jgi:hypothetical protein
MIVKPSRVTDDAVWVSDWAGNAVYRVPLAKLAP